MVFSKRTLYYRNGYGMIGKYYEDDYVSVSCDGMKYLGLIVQIDRNSFDLELEDGDTISVDNLDVYEIKYLGSYQDR